ncbi:metallophosphatase family protein [Niabella sp. W65]|nr:metallophosphatase family protein [Niabella sp. W65]MCH7362119.1 metallophosphatase family protein [Niabella sp. W65]ULT45870.1 metallophosphatase family protein [Niabella sp. I65]
MIRIGLISDTHSFLDGQVFKHFEQCDEIWHAGDFGDAAIAQQLRAFKPLRGVYGNIDGADIRSQFGEVTVFAIEKVKVMMKHIGGIRLSIIQKLKSKSLLKSRNFLLAGTLIS